MNGLDEQRQVLIERIKQVFPKKPRGRGKKVRKLVRGKERVAGERLKETFEGKSWEEAVSNPSVVYNLSDVDHLWEITDEAYLYYLPAFLVATLNRPERLVFYSFPFFKIGNLFSKFSLEQLDVLIRYFEFLVQFWQQYEIYDIHFVEAAEDIQLRLMVYRDDIASKGK
jgi:hypothetical protein